MRLALDTNAFVSFCKGHPKQVAVIQKAGQIFIPFIVLAELRAGFLCGSRPAKNEVSLTQFLNSPRVEILYADTQTTHHYARLFFQLRHQRTPIPINDLWIAALTMQHDLILLTNDRHFDYLPQISKA